jgi:hypothetical protein
MPLSSRKMTTRNPRRKRPRKKLKLKRRRLRINKYYSLLGLLA